MIAIVAWVGLAKGHGCAGGASRSAEDLTHELDARLPMRLFPLDLDDLSGHLVDDWRSHGRRLRGRRLGRRAHDQAQPQGHCHYVDC